MAGHRFTHPEQSQSRRVTALSDFEYRVWEQTKLSADDFGVLPLSALQLRTDNARLRKATDGEVEAALARLVVDGLLVPFEHQGERYACAPAWASWQVIAYPRRTIRPLPGADVVFACDPMTQWFFGFHPGGTKVPKRPRFTALQEDSGNIPETFPESSKAKAGGTPSNSHSHSDSNSDLVLEGGPGETAPPRQPPRVPPGRPSLIDGPGAWGVRHADHVDGFCDFVCLPRELSREFVNRVISVSGLGEATSTEQVLAWAHQVRDRYRASGRIPGTDVWRFWKHEWEATHGSNRPTAKPRGHANVLDRIIARGWRSHG